MTTFKSSSSASEASATHALQSLNIGEDNISDEYDFVDDMDETDANGAHDTSRRNPKEKYVVMLQKVANRELSEICIELDDLSTVGIPNPMAFQTDEF